MGYRIKLGKIPKSEKARYSDRTIEEAELICGLSGGSLYDPAEHEVICELGKYVSYGDGLMDFYDFDTEHELEMEFFIMPKESLKLVIDSYHEDIHDNYELLLRYVRADDEEKRQIDIENMTTGRNAIESFLETRKNEWTVGGQFGLLPYYLDQEKTDGDIVSSWQKEYGIFNLVHIYRFFDWENDYLIYSGW